MGLIKQNYKTPQGRILPTAYALYSHSGKVGKGELRTAYFDIYESREDYDIGNKPYDTVKNDFVWDRKRNLVEQAYEEAKKTKQVYKGFDYEKGEEIYEIVDGIFTGWVDHIVGE